MGYYSDGQYIWENGANTPLNATNLNRLEGAVFDLYKSKTRVQQVLVDVANTTGVASDVNGEFNDASKPYLTVEGVLNDLYVGTTTEIFILGNAVIDADEFRISGSAVSFVAYGDGSTQALVDANTSKLTITNNAKVQLLNSSTVSFYIDTEFVGMTDVARGVGVGDGCVLNFFNHRVHYFNDSPSVVPYTQQARDAVILIDGTTTAPFVRIFGVNGGISFSKTNMNDGSGVGDFFTVLNTNFGVKASLASTKINSTLITASTLYDRFTAGSIIFHDGAGSAIPANVSSNISFYGLS